MKWKGYKNTSEFKNSWTKTGCTIMSDGWTDSRGRTIRNFLVAFPKGTMFLRSVDASDQVKDAHLLFCPLDDVVKEVGAQNVVQVITDNASNYVAAGKLLEDKHPTIWKVVRGQTSHHLANSMCSPLFGPHA